MRDIIAAAALSAAALAPIASAMADAGRSGEASLRKEGMFGILTARLSQPEQVVLCDTIGTSLVEQSTGTADPALREKRLAAAWLLHERLSAALQRAKAQLGTGFEAARRRANEAVGVMSMAPDPATLAAAKGDGDVLHAFLQGLGEKCHARLDRWGVPRANGAPPAAFLTATASFRFRGNDSAAVFAGSGLAPYAARMCRGGAAPDFAGAPLAERGMDGMSLLDWAMECDDLPAFEALLTAGADAGAAGLWGDPPVVNAATEKRLPYLTRLLDKGAKADVMGRSETALETASRDYDAINGGGNPRAAFDLLRARGATLDFPDFGHSMWNRWALHENRWDLIRDNWSEFRSDPVALARVAEYILQSSHIRLPKDRQVALHEVKARLAADFGVCFPIAGTTGAQKDARGFLIQTGCPTK